MPTQSKERGAGRRLVRRILAVFAHPDDETFLAGGTPAKYAAAGWDVFLLCATHGEAGRRGEYSHLTQGQFARLRQQELEAAAHALGIRRSLFLDGADQQLARDCWASAAQEIIRAIRRIRPEVVITFGPDGISGHPDHVALSQIVTTAFWTADLTSVLPAESSEFPPFAPSRLYYVLRSASVPRCCEAKGSLEAPPLTTVIDIREYSVRKLEGIRSYQSQKHLQSEDLSVVERILNTPENFHRAVPAWQGPAVERDLYPQSDSTLPPSGAAESVSKR
jgi:LmbE family N-acetylglucosaminyl deacetylase